MSNSTSKVALITGSSRSIGRASAFSLALSGVDVVVNYVSHAAAAQEVVSKIKGMGRRSAAIRADVGSLEQVNRMVSEVIDTFERIDILVNNAGLNLPARFWETTESEWDQICATNLKGVYNCCRTVLPHMIESRSGRIINISSVVAITGFRGSTIYAATKAGIVGLTTSLSREVGRYGILVNAVMPGYIVTEAHTDRSAMTPRYEEKVLHQIPLARFGKPEDIAEVIRFLALEGNYITGAVIPVSGGWLPQI